MVSVRSRHGAPFADFVDIPGTRSRSRHLLVLDGMSRVDGAGRQALRGLLGEAIMRSSATLAALLESFFTQRLMNQRQASPHTISSYRDTFRLLLQFAQQRLHKPPARLDFEEIDAPMIAAFLDDLEKSRGIISSKPQSTLDGDPLLLSLCRLRRAVPCRSDSARAGHTGQAPHAHLSSLPESSRNRRLARGSRSRDLVWSPRSCLDPGGGPNRSALIGVDRPATP